MKVITIGRSKDNDVIVNDEKISRNHLQIIQNDNGSYSVVDLGSANGTFINGQRIAGETHLQANDIVKIGNTILPWESYFIGEPKSQVDFESKPKHTVWYIVVAVVLLFVASGVFLKIYSDKEKNKIEAESIVKVEMTQQLQQETARKEAEAKQLQVEADKLRQKALISQSDADKRLAEQAQENANIAHKEANIAKAAQLKAEKERDEAVNAKNEALKAKEMAEKQKTIADSIAVSEKRKAEIAKEEAEKAKLAIAVAEEKERQAREDASKKNKDLTKERDAERARAEKLKEELEKANAEKEEIIKNQKAIEEKYD